MIVAKYAALSAVLYVLLLGLGLPIRLLIAPRADNRLNFVFAPLLGFVPLSIFGWYVGMAGRGLRSGIWFLVATAVVANIVVLVLVRRPERGGTDWRAAGASVAVAGASVALVLVHFAGVFRLPYFTAVAIGNYDSPNYALVAKTVEEGGFDDAGPVEGWDTGELARNDTYGSLALVAAGAAITGMSPWKFLLPALFVSILLAIAALFALVLRLMNGGPWRSAAVAIGASSSYLFFFTVGNYYLSQILGMATVACLLVSYADAVECKERGELARHLLGAGLLLHVMFMLYHMSLKHISYQTRQ